jgi:hypothetical protein
MIVFNLFAIPIVLLVGAVGAGLIWLMPGVFGGPHEEITYSVLAILIGGLGEVVGLRGRLFFLPIWLIGGAVLAWQLWTLFGMIGLVAGGGLLGMLVVAFVVVLVFTMASAEKEAPKRLEEARGLLAEGKLGEARTALGQAFMLPLFRTLKPEHAPHLRAVLSVVEQHQGPLGIDGDGARVLVAARVLLDRVQAGTSYGFFSDEANLLGTVEPMLTDADKWQLRDDLREMLAKVA